jgi:hypothetical protein
LGHRLAQGVGDVMTLGAYRRGNRLPWLPPATIDVWVGCPRGEMATGVPSPHVYFIQTIGGRTADDGSIYCPSCRGDLTARRANGTSAPPITKSPASEAPVPELPLQQGALPF